MSTAFSITEVDIETVLRSYALRVTDSKGMSFSDLAAELVLEIDHDRIEKAALQAGITMDQQFQGAFKEIKHSLVELGVLEF